MPVQIPSLNRIAPQEPGSFGKIDTSVTDTSKSTAAITQSAGSLINEYNDYQIKAEEHAIDLSSTKYNSDYELTRKVKLQKLKGLQGDPTAAYAEYEASAQKDMEDIIGAVPDASPRLQQAMREKMSKTNYTLRDNAAVAQESQRTVWDRNVTTTQGDLIKDRILDASQFITGKDPKTLSNLQAGINDYRDNLAKWGERNGLVTTDPKTGKQTYSPILEEEMKKGTSEALKNVVMSLNNVGKTDESKMVLDLFGNDINATTRTKLSDDHKDSVIHGAALTAVDQVRMKFKNDDDQLKALDKFPADVREKAMNILNSQQAHKAAAKERASKQTFEEQTQNILKNKDQFLTVDDLRNDPAFKIAKASGRLDAKQIDALEEQVFAPKHTAPETQMRVYDQMSKGTLGKLSVGELNQMLLGANEDFRKKTLTRYENDISQSGAEKRQMISYMGTQLEKQMQAAGLVSKGDTGRYSNSHQVKITEAYNKMLEDIDTMNPGTTQAEQLKYIREFVADSGKEGVFKKFPAPSKFKAAPAKAPDVPAGATPPEPNKVSPFISLPTSEKAAWIKLYNQKNPGQPFNSKTSDMDKFRRENKL